jgi:hypothetical protein
LALRHARGWPVYMYWNIVDKNWSTAINNDEKSPTSNNNDKTCVKHRPDDITGGRKLYKRITRNRWSTVESACIIVSIKLPILLIIKIIHTHA